jgi:hypothetical protein
LFRNEKENPKMAPDERQNLDRVVGGLEAKVDAFQANWQEQDRRAADGRKYLYEKVEAFGREVQGFGHQLAAVATDVAEMKPAVRDWVSAKNQAMGAKTAAGILGRLAYLAGGGVILLVGWFIEHASTILRAAAMH